MDIFVIIRYIIVFYGLFQKKEKYVFFGGKMLNFKSSFKFLIYILLYFMDFKENKLIFVYKF